jgi:hypothetical protein
VANTNLVLPETKGACEQLKFATTQTEYIPVNKQALTFIGDFLFDLPQRAVQRLPQSRTDHFSVLNFSVF